jgi:F-type H+-transporting ATPase subunit delta
MSRRRGRTNALFQFPHLVQLPWTLFKLRQSGAGTTDSANADGRGALVASPAPRYARAFAEVAEASHLDATAAHGQLQDFADTLADSFELRELLLNPSVALAQKLKVLDAIAARAEMLPQVRNFLAVILEHDRLGDLGDIIGEYGEVADAHAGAAEASITTARPLSQDDRGMLEEQIAKLVGASVRATYAEDPTLLGGAVVQIGSTIYDGSIKAQLQQLKRRMVNA